MRFILSTIVCFSLFNYTNAQTKEELNQKAALSYQSGNYEEAMRIFSKVIELFPTDSLAYFDRGMTKEMLRDYTGAIADYSAQLKIDDESVDSYFLRGLMRQKTGDRAGAMEDLKKVIELEYGNADAHYFMGKMYLEDFDYKKALKYFKETIKVNPYHSEAYTEIAITSLYQGKKAKAAKPIQAALKNDSLNYRAFLIDGWLKAEDKNSVEALKSYWKSIQLNPYQELKYPDFPAGKHKNIDLGEAFDNLRLSIKKSDLKKSSELGLLAILIGQPQKAYDIFQAVLKEDSNFDLALYGLSIYASNQKDYTNAIAYINHAIAMEKNNAFYFLERATIKLKMQLVDLACEDYKQYQKIIFREDYIPIALWRLCR